MKPQLLQLSRLPLLIGALLMAGASMASAQNLYMVMKGEDYIQTSSSGSTSTGYEFSAQGGTAVTLTKPDATTQSLSYNSNDQDYQYRRYFTTKSALDAAFPNGTYQMTGSGLPTLSLNMTTELYPSVAPSVVGGTWVNGVLVLNPAVSNTITFSTNSGFSTSGTAGHMETSIHGMFDNVELSNQIVSREAFGITVSSTPLTTISIPAGTLTAGKLYECQISFDTLSTLDTTTVSGGGVVALWSRRLGFYIGASSTVTAPTISTHPTSRTAYVGGTAKFVVMINVSGSAQNNTISDWLFNGQRIDIDGTKYSMDWNTGTFTINNITSADFGSYSLRAVNSGGMVTSNTATLSEATNYLSNMSVRAATDASKTLIVGFVVDGGAKNVLVRAAGPTLTTLPYGLTGVTDPRLGLFNISNSQVASNDNWSASLATTFSSLGAFAFVNGSNDSALLQSINGPHTAQATCTNAGTILVEAYDAAVSSVPKLSNLSARFPVGTGDNVLIAGFVLAGTGNRQLLVRAVGPKLADYGVTGVLANPQLAIFDGATQLYTNDNWSGSLASTFSTLGAFSLSSDAVHTTNDTQSAGLVVTLPAGDHAYTVQVSGVGGTTGEALVEIYAIP